MKPIKYHKKTYKFVNEVIIDGITHTAYRYPSNKGGGCIIVSDGKKRKIESKNLKEAWNKILNTK